MNDLDELITLATVSTSFQQDLLTNPEQALKNGYQGKKLELSDSDKEILFRANASSLEELAKYILNHNLRSEIDSQTSVNQPTILLVSDYPLMTDTISTLLEKDFNIRETSTDHIIEDVTCKDISRIPIILFYCNTEMSLKLYTKLICVLDNQQLVILTDIKNIPESYLANTAFISLKESQHQIVKTLKDIYKKKTSYSPQAAIQLAQRYTTTDHRQSLQKLTKREQEIIRHLALTNKEIARRLNISPGTVRSHILKINKKLGFDMRKKLFPRLN